MLSHAILNLLLYLYIKYLFDVKNVGIRNALEPCNGLKMLWNECFQTLLKSKYLRELVNQSSLSGILGAFWFSQSENQTIALFRR